MQNKKLVRFVQSLVLLPVTTFSVPLGGLAQAGYQALSNNPQIVFFQNNAPTDAELLALKDRAMKAEAIDAYFEERDMPLYGSGAKMVEVAESNDLDWRLIPAIAVRESTGGKHDCKRVDNNPFGWNSCKVGFDTIDQAIEILGKNLGGNNPNTAHHYDSKTTKEILRAYNPPSIVPRYAEQVIAIMNSIGDADLGAVANS